MSRPEASNSLAQFPGPVAQPNAQFYGTTSYASPGKPSGNVRSCTSTTLTHPEPIRGNPSLRNTALSGHCGGRWHLEELEPRSFPPCRPDKSGQNPTPLSLCP